MKKKHILTLSFGFLACLYVALAAVSLYTDGILPLVISDGVWVAAVFSIAALLFIFCRKGTFSLSWYNYSVMTVGALACTLISGYFTVTAEYETLYEFSDVLANTLPTLSLGVCFGFWWLVGVIRQRKSGGETKR